MVQSLVRELRSCKLCGIAKIVFVFLFLKRVLEQKANICQVLAVGYISSGLFCVFGILHKFLFENGEELAEQGGRRSGGQREGLGGRRDQEDGRDILLTLPVSRAMC